MTAYGKDVWNYAYSITHKRDQADDITQEVFLKVFRNLYSFRCESSVKTWLLAITRNMSLDYRRSAFLRKVVPIGFSPFESAGASAAASASAEEEALGKMALSDTWRLVLQLPVKYREVLVLFAHYQLSMKEMAEVLGVSEGTVKSRLFHARNKISKLKEKKTLGSEGQ
ncbi:sigma-70 family RNA polymerase sigma factor [Paenibacillus cremeus]|uniref:RNA polymerase sigma factor n=2 Tax=Paenibacillus cremeus TaxID=2163881 RepID=A0A559K4J7_9BACL|nr:sigma-70 family RNA polymerase sigma factor [Paenibacillus cremeus]